MREQLLQDLPWFVKAVARVPGVRKISLLGSITTDKKNPKDIDFLVTIEETTDLKPLARLGRKISGHSMGIQHGADVFLANPQGALHWQDMPLEGLSAWYTRLMRCAALRATTLLA